jgi:hypothetical protein
MAGSDTQLRWCVLRPIQNAGYFALFGAVASYVGIVHGPQFRLGAAPGAALGYLLIALLWAFYANSIGGPRPGRTRADGNR